MLRRAGALLTLCVAVWLALPAGDAFAALTSLQGKKDLVFGSAAGDADLAGTVVMDAADAKSVTGGVFNLGGADQSGQFQLNGSSGDPYTCTLPSQIQVSAGASTMTVDTFVTDNPLDGTLPGKNIKFKVGATLHVPAGQAAGSYSGTLTMTCGPFQNSVAVTATLGNAISISNSNSLEFGSVEPTGIAGLVTISPSGGRTTSNVIIWPGPFGASTFDVTGEGNQAYAITLPSSATLSGPGTDMTVDTFTHDAGANPALSGGSATFNVGATLHVGASQAAGLYSGTFAVTVNYN